MTSFSSYFGLHPHGGGADRLELGCCSRLLPSMSFMRHLDQNKLKVHPKTLWTVINTGCNDNVDEMWV